MFVNVKDFIHSVDVVEPVVEPWAELLERHGYLIVERIEVATARQPARRQPAPRRPRGDPRRDPSPGVRYPRYRVTHHVSDDAAMAAEHERLKRAGYIPRVAPGPPPHPLDPRSSVFVRSE